MTPHFRKDRPRQCPCGVQVGQGTDVVAVGPTPIGPFAKRVRALTQDVHAGVRFSVPRLQLARVVGVGEFAERALDPAARGGLLVHRCLGGVQLGHQALVGQFQRLARIFALGQVERVQRPPPCPGEGVVDGDAARARGWNGASVCPPGTAI